MKNCVGCTPYNFPNDLVVLSLRFGLIKMSVRNLLLYCRSLSFLLIAPFDIFIHRKNLSLIIYLTLYFILNKCFGSLYTPCKFHFIRIAKFLLDVNVNVFIFIRFHKLIIHKNCCIFLKCCKLQKMHCERNYHN